MELYEKNGNILYILNVLKKYTDEEHMLSAVEIQEKTYIEKNGKTIGAILDENLKNKEHLNRVCQSTILRDRNTANVILKAEIANIPVQQVTRQDTQNFLNDIALIYSNSYLDKIYTHLNNVMKISTLDHLINENPFAIGAINKPKSAKPDKVVDALTREEQEFIANTLIKLVEEAKALA